MNKIIFIIGITAVVLFLQSAVLLWLGQPMICECGFIKLWWGIVQSAGNSQHIADWYSWSHIIHGFVLYAILWFLFPRISIWKRFLFAVGIEVGWEIIENTPLVIESYREQALAQGYNGDSVINSIFDTLFMVFGFWFTRLFPVWVTIAAAFGLEAWVGYSVRDNLTLNILNFVYHFEFIERWQSGGG